MQIAKYIGASFGWAYIIINHGDRLLIKIVCFITFGLFFLSKFTHVSINYNNTILNRCLPNWKSCTTKGKNDFQKPMIFYMSFSLICSIFFISSLPIVIRSQNSLLYLSYIQIQLIINLPTYNIQSSYNKYTAIVPIKNDYEPSIY